MAAVLVVGAGATVAAAQLSHHHRHIDGNPAGTGKPFARSSPLSPSHTKGGTLRVGSAGDVDYMDPARSYYAFSWDIHQLFNRTLLTYRDGTGRRALKPVGDIAKGPAKPRRHNTIWKYKLRSGIKFQDGSPVTSKSIKYAIERTFATNVINGGPSYFITFLCPRRVDKSGACRSYRGPYRTKAARYGLSTIKTPNQHTIVFHLNQPFAEWNYAMTLLGTSPVEAKVDQNPRTGGNRYNFHVQSTGPYKIASYRAGRHIDLVRNPKWNPRTDPTRSALPDKIDIKTSFDSGSLDHQLINNNEDLDIGGTGVQPAAESKILRDPSLQKRTLDPITGFTRYVSILQETKPFNHLHCRRAVEYAMSRNEQEHARGGAYDGTVATTLGPPTLEGWKYFNEYPGTESGNAKVRAAKKQLTKCGKPHGFKTTIVTTNVGHDPEQAQFLQKDLEQVGIRANIKVFDPATYYAFVIGDPGTLKKDHYGLAFAGWGPDWPAPYGFFENIVDPRRILRQGNSNYGACSDRHITKLINKALRKRTVSAELPDWRRVDKVVNKDACDAPYLYDKAVDLFSARLRNVYIEPQYGIVDIRTLGVR